MKLLENGLNYTQTVLHVLHGRKGPFRREDVMPTLPMGPNWSPAHDEWDTMSMILLRVTKEIPCLRYHPKPQEPTIVQASPDADPEYWSPPFTDLSPVYEVKELPIMHLEEAFTTIDRGEKPDMRPGCCAQCKYSKHERAYGLLRTRLCPELSIYQQQITAHERTVDVFRHPETTEHDRQLLADLASDNEFAREYTDTLRQQALRHKLAQLSENHPQT